MDRRVDSLQRLHDDQKRLEWCMVILELTEAPPNVADHRVAAMAAALMLGKTGRDALDYAMEGSP